MATAEAVVRKALKRILVEADEAPLESTELSDAYDIMNDYMASLEAINVKLGYTTVSAGTDEVTIPAGALRGLIANLGVELSPDYGGYVSQALVKSANDGMKAMRRLGRVEIQTKYPVTLPMGAGNDDSTFYNYEFYSLQDSALLSLSGNTEATTISGTDTKVLVAGDWRVEAGKGFQGDIDGLVKNVSGNEIDVDVKVELVATGNSTYTFTLMRNGYDSETSAASAVTATPTTVTLSKLVTLDPGDWLSLYVEDDLATADVTVVDCQFRVS